MSLALDFAALRFDPAGLIPVVVQDATTGAVLMLAYANQEALERTLESGRMHFYSRSRGRLWLKGETSGNVLEVSQLLPDCDGDALLARAHPAGPTCHRGTRSCFDGEPAALELGWLARVVADRRTADPQASYTARLLAEGVDRLAQKVGEEGVETALAAVRHQPGSERLAAEAADLLYHLVVLLEATGVGLEPVAAELARRASGRRGKES